MEAYLRQQFNFLLITATERFVERIVQRSGGLEAALTRLRVDPQGGAIWLDEFVRALFQDFLLDNVAGACFVLQALARRQVDPPPPGRIEVILQQLALRTFADLLAVKAEEALEQQSSFSR
jgi:hypothetical protein